MKAKTILRKRVQKKFTKPSMTKQNHKAECDINQRVKNFIQTGITTGNTKTPQYGNFDNEISYQQSLNAIIQAQDQFDQLPSNTRKKFDNDPAKLIHFVSDKKNYEEAVKLGLIDQPQAPLPPQRVEIVNPPTLDDPKK